MSGPGVDLTPVGAVAPAGVVLHSGQQFVTPGANGHVIRNSPYGSKRPLYGWGDLFRPGKTAIVPGWSNIHIGVSSLNAVPGADRRMRTLMTKYQKKFNCLEHCYTFHNVGDEDMWRTWRELALLPMNSGPSSSPAQSPRQRDQGTCVKEKADTPCKYACGEKRRRASQNEVTTDDVEASFGYDDDVDSCANCGNQHSPFMYTIKANRYLTHNRLLVMDDATKEHITQFFVQRCTLLEHILGPVLFQLPPHFPKTGEHVARIEAVAACLPKNIRVAVEFRHVSWYAEDTRELLQRLQWAQVVAHNLDISAGSVHVDTGVPFMYVRMHGPLGRNVGDYGPLILSSWAKRIVEFVRSDRDGTDGKVDGAVTPKREVFFFFNNGDSSVGGTTSSVVDATCLAEKVRMLLARQRGAIQGVDYVDVNSSESSCNEDDRRTVKETFIISD
ncbi:hypothetical protein DPX39_100071600 [Trypanosoma brucei equiperdum]|uniref:Uncharacterized protein n=1 Tax=Trypanosoma brucei equiperdum TaxID=630700 RepID=A0A3L6KXD4_9TRYP|nr:hypothetical protein DPX39_100071600 [Trypanosoma brucei equiperdum]